MLSRKQTVRLLALLLCLCLARGAVSVRAEETEEDAYNITSEELEAMMEENRFRYRFGWDATVETDESGEPAAVPIGSAPDSTMRGKPNPFRR